MINTVWQGFPGFFIAFVMKRLLYVEIRVFRKKKRKGNWRCRKATVGYCPFLGFCCEREFSVVTEFSSPVSRQWLSVATSFGLGQAFLGCNMAFFVSRQSWLSVGKIMLRKSHSMSRQSWLMQGKVCRDRASLCRDIVGQGRENLCHERGLLGRDRAGHDRVGYEMASASDSAHGRCLAPTTTLTIGAQSERQRSHESAWERGDCAQGTRTTRPGRSLS